MDPQHQAASDAPFAAFDWAKPHPHPPHPAMDTVWGDSVATWGIPLCSLVGIFFALFLWKRVAAIKVRGGAAVRSENGREYLLEEEQRGESEVR